jgi:hypothetical protein
MLNKPEKLFLLKNNTTSKKIAKPKAVETWFGPKPPTVAKLDDALNLISSKSGVFIYKYTIIDKNGKTPTFKL